MMLRYINLFLLFVSGAVATPILGRLDLTVSLSTGGLFSVELTLTNTGDHSLWLLKKGSPLDGFSLANLIHVSCDEHEVEFLGPFIHFDNGVFHPNDFIHLPPNGSTSTTFDISRSFDLLGSGCPRVVDVSIEGSFHAAVSSGLTTETPDVDLPHEILVSHSGIQINIEPDELKARQEYHEIQARYLVESQHQCTSSQLKEIDAAFVRARSLALKAADYLRHLNTYKRRDFVTTYFGKLGEENAVWLAKRFEAIADYAQKNVASTSQGYGSEPVKATCRDTSKICATFATALAYGLKPYLLDYQLIVFCPHAFEYLPRNNGCRKIDQGSNALHELSHRPNVVGPDPNKDYAYQWNEILVLSNEKRLRNARSYEYFAHDVESCNLA